MEEVSLKLKLEIQNRQINELMAIKHKYLRLQEEFIKVKVELDKIKNGKV